MLNNLRNLGPTSIQMLNATGINSQTELRELGSIAAYMAIKQSGQKPSLNMLWALEGALTDRDWKDVANNDRLELLLKLEELENNINP